MFYLDISFILLRHLMFYGNAFICCPIFHTLFLAFGIARLLILKILRCLLYRQMIQQHIFYISMKEDIANFILAMHVIYEITY